jgi:hypothetical protein
VAWLDATATPDRNLRTRVPGGFNSLIPVGVAPGGAGTSLPSESAAMKKARLPTRTLAEADARPATVAADPAFAVPADDEPTAANVGDHQRRPMPSARCRDRRPPEAWLDLAAEEALLGHDDAARATLERAARLGLQRPALAMGIGELAERLGDLELSDRAYVAAISTVPSLAGDHWWLLEPSREARFRAIIDAAMEAAGATDSWQIALMAGEADVARGLLVGDAAAATRSDRSSSMRGRAMTAPSGRFSRSATPSR